jgi:hypothetical protein
VLILAEQRREVARRNALIGLPDDAVLNALVDPNLGLIRRG